MDASIVARDAGRLGTALALAKAGARAEPSDARAWHQLGLVFHDLGEMSRAAAALDHGLVLASTQPRLLFARARVDLARGRLDAAREFLARAEAVAPGEPAIGQTRAAVELAAGRPDAALSALRGAAARADADPAALDLLASLAHQLGVPDAWRDTYAPALAARPRDGVLWLAYVDALLAAGRPHDALDAVAQARARVGETAGLREAEIAALVAAGGTDRAGALLDALAPPADTVALRLARVAVHLRRGDPETAAELALAAATVPGGEQLWPYVATAWRAAGDERAHWLHEAPGLVATIDLPLAADELANLAAALRGLHRTRVAPAEQSLRGGTQTDGDLLLRQEPPIAQLRAALQTAIAQYVEALPADPLHPTLARAPTATRFAGSWSVRLTDGGHHIDHVHPKGWLSSAFYVALPEAEPPEGWLRLGQPPPALGLDLPPSRRVEPVPGRLVLFPSWLWHGTEPFPSGERLTVAFDVVPLN